MTAVILFLLLLLVIYFYFTGTVEHLFHSIRVTGRMFMILLVVFLVLGLLAYSFIKFGTLPF